MSRKSRRSLRALRLNPAPKAKTNRIGSLTVSLLFRHWVPSMLPLYKPSTRQFLTTTIGILEDDFGGLTVEQVTNEPLQSYVAEVELSPKTMANRISVFRTVWRAARKWSYVQHNPFEGLVMPRLIEPEARCFTLQEVTAILNSAKEPYRTLYQLAAETGLRGGEICALPWSEVDLEKQTIRVVQSIWRGELSSPKTRAGRRSVCISSGVPNMWREAGREMRIEHWLAPN
jgi:integrase